MNILGALRMGGTRLKPVGADVRRLAAQALPPGENALDSHGVVPGCHMPVPPKKHRPAVFQGRNSPGDWLVRVGLPGAALLSGVSLNPADAPGRLYEAWQDRERQKGKPFFGGWGSTAGTMAAALAPVASTGVACVLLLTELRLHIVYVEQARFSGEPGEAVLGPSLERAQVTWLRDRRDMRAGEFEFGFADGSWTTVHFPGAGWGTLVESFPVRLKHTQPHP
ncbi:hypothetical protein [Streptomyces sp. HB2AG]|uniref:hypothetical protein n=1 Tax=Streptomyces sp. HB2AG TaxID=2983400 RepID=UPI0022AA07A0|nr:hypothetical protein [Streptomyces sp. HB2AG]MCZ2524838.1 hypothetical protein [Streptomyces sp. HB2AG]